MLVELFAIGSSVLSTGIGTLIGFGIARKADVKQPKPKPVVDGVMEWAWISDNKAFCCPKCNALITVTGSDKDIHHPVICSCEEYHREHFHFTCVECKYQAIMKTADDQ